MAALRPRLSVTDFLHRGLVWSLFGVTVWGAVMIGVVHRGNMKAGEGMCRPSIALRRPLALMLPIYRLGLEVRLLLGSLDRGS